ncbi:MAG: DnaA regulatory inactivator Hda [Methylotenera sp.]|nr:DnaA regulatory inactivator Hda [Methylotenera sp.]
MKQLLLDIKPAAPPTLQNFVVGRNAEALSSLQAAVNGQNPQFIYLWGESGSGKSHLLQACQAIGASIVDDVHLLSNCAQIDLFNQYNQCKEAGEWMITAGLHAPTQMGLRDDVATRLAWGLVYQLQPLNDMEKATALKQHAFERGMKLPDEVVDYCLRYLRRDLPTLMATLDALDEWSLTMQKPITVPMLRKLLQLNLDLND